MVEDGNGRAAGCRSFRHQLVELLTDGSEIGMNKTFHADILHNRWPLHQFV